MRREIQSARTLEQQLKLEGNKRTEAGNSEIMSAIGNIKIKLQKWALRPKNRKEEKKRPYHLHKISHILRVSSVTTQQQQPTTFIRIQHKANSEWNQNRNVGDNKNRSQNTSYAQKQQKEDGQGDGIQKNGRQYLILNRQTALELLSSNSHSQQIIKRMQKKKNPQSALPLFLTTLFKLTYSYSFRKVMLYPEKDSRSPGKIRFYDKECEAIQNIASIIKSPMERKKMVSFFQIKTCTEPKEEGSKTFRANSTLANHPRKLTRQTSGTRSGTINYSKTFNSSAKENQLRDIFSRVKVIANSLLPKDDNHVPKHTPLSILTDITKLEHEMTDLVKTDRMASTATSTFSRSSGWKRILKILE